MKAEHYRTEVREISGVRVNVRTYRIAERYHCHIDNVDPGATIARAEADSLAEAEQAALSKALTRLARK